MPRGRTASKTADRELAQLLQGYSIEVTTHSRSAVEACRAHLAPGNSAGTLNVGSLNLASDAVLDYELANPAASDRTDNGHIVADCGSQRRGLHAA